MCIITSLSSIQQTDYFRNVTNLITSIASHKTLITRRNLQMEAGDCRIAIATSRTILVHTWIKVFQRNGTDRSHLFFVATGLTDDTKRMTQNKSSNVSKKVEKAALAPHAAYLDPVCLRGPGQLTCSRWIRKYIRCPLGGRVDQWQVADI